MNSLVKVFSNFKEFYSEINGATLTGAIDVIVVEQPNGTYLCSPFHVRFGKLGVLRSRQKIVDIEVNGEPVDIHMKLGESGEAFFVEECDEDDLELLPANMATSPLPSSDFAKYVETAAFTNVNEEEAIIDLPKPRRNSIDFSKESDEVHEKKFENQVSDYSHRRHTDTMERHNLIAAKKEFTTQKIRQEWAEHEEQILGIEGIAEEWSSSGANDASPAASVATPIADATASEIGGDRLATSTNADNAGTPAGDAGNAAKSVDETKSKKKRRKKSMMKKKATQRKSSSSSSIGSVNSDQHDPETDTLSTTVTTATSSSTEESPKSTTDVHALVKSETVAVDDVPVCCASASDGACGAKDTPPTVCSRARDLDIHFFSDTEITSAKSPDGSRPSTPIQSDSEFEMSHRGGGGLQHDGADLMASSSASWKWGELPTQGDDTQLATTEDAKQAQRNSMLSNMFSFMKQTKKMRKTSQAEGVYLSELDTDGMDPEVAALYFPAQAASQKANGNDNNGKRAPAVGGGARPEAIGVVDDDRESGNGTSLPHSPSSMDGLKSLDSDYEDGKPGDNKCLDFVAMSLCGGIENGTGPTEEEFDRSLIGYSEVCQNPSIFASPELVVRLNGKYYSWAAACPIVMTIIAYQKPLTIDAIEQLMMNKSLGDVSGLLGGNDEDGGKPPGQLQQQQQAQKQQQRGGYSWWSWRRSGGDVSGAAAATATAQSAHLPTDKTLGGDSDGNSTLLDVSGSGSPTAGEAASFANDSLTPPQTPGTDQQQHRVPSLLDATADSDLFGKSQDVAEDVHTGEMYRKSLRLTSEQIESLNLKHGMNEISFSVTTAYQGTSRCKCYLFRWKHSDKVVISDIDGTITKSDVLGHILPMVGRDWAQIGVAQLFSKIEENGYKLLYLSARAIGQSRATREYLRSIRQGDVKLPDGPLLLNPTSLISAFHREVIEKKPEQFKIACLSDIRDLFPDKNPFYAGYGNRINDVWAYRAVGIPIMRIFTINPKGELKHELTQTFQSSYCNMAYIADQLFPPIATIEESAEFSNFNFWREPVFELDDLLISSADVLAATASLPTSQFETKIPTSTSGELAAGKSTEDAQIVVTSSAALSSSPAPQTVDSSQQQQKHMGSPKSLATIPENHKV